jgi:ribosomal protein L21E
MAELKTGDRVKIVDREMNLSDIKSGMFYDYFRNLTGTVQNIYDDKTVCVQVEQDSLPNSIKDRHQDVQESVTKRWLANVSQEQRDKMKEAEKSLTLAYNILVNSADLEVIGKGKVVKPKPTAAPATTASKAKEDQPHRPTQSEIEKAEEEYLKSIASKQTS